MEKEDSQTFSIGELQHPHTIYIKVHYVTYVTVTAGAFALCISNEFNVFLFVAFLDEAERKYLFECDSEEQCGEWIDSIIKAR